MISRLTAFQTLEPMVPHSRFRALVTDQTAGVSAITDVGTNWCSLHPFTARQGPHCQTVWMTPARAARNQLTMGWLSTPLFTPTADHCTTPCAPLPPTPHPTVGVSSEPHVVRSVLHFHLHVNGSQHVKPRLDPWQSNQVRSFRVFDLGLVIML